MPRPPRPDDLARIRVPTEPRLSSDGRVVVFTVQLAGPQLDRYRHELWIAVVDVTRPARRLTIGAQNDTRPRFSPDGGTLAFLSDRRLVTEPDPAAPADREDAVQVHLLPLDAGEATRLTDLPRGVTAAEWSPDGEQLVVVSTSFGVTREDDARRRRRRLRPRPGEPPESDYRYLDRLAYQANGVGFVENATTHLWLVDARSGAAHRLTDSPSSESSPAWSPDGTRIAFLADRRRDHDLGYRSDVWVRDLASGREWQVTGGGDGRFFAPTWLPDGRTIAVLGERAPRQEYGNEIWLFAADGSDAGPRGGRSLTAGTDLMPGATMNSDVTIGEEARVVPTGEGDAILFLAPAAGAYELWRVSAVAAGIDRVERLTDGRHYLSSFDAVPLADGGIRVAAVRSAPTALPDVHVGDVTRGTQRPIALRKVTDLNADLAAEVALVEPLERHWTVDGRSIQGWLLPAAAGRQPLVTEIHGGPHTLYGCAPVWEFQVLAGDGMSVLYANPRGSEGYGRAFNEANLGDWGDGPMRDVLAGVAGAVDDGLADRERLGVTGGSYGGYLTNWIVAHDGRFRAALTARSVADMLTLFLVGDISSGEWAKEEFGRLPWEDPDYFRSISPLTYATRIRTPLLIQHSERDLRTTIGQAEALFTVLRSLRRPVRLMRVPDETHELTRSGTPFRRIENLVQVRDWFRHYLVAGKRGLPPLPKDRGGK